MATYRIKTMGQDLKRAQGEKVESLEIQVQRTTEKAPPEAEGGGENLKEEGSLRKDYKKEGTPEGGFIGHMQEKEQKVSEGGGFLSGLSDFSLPSFSLPSFSFSLGRVINKKLIYTTAFLVVLGLGGFFYFNYFASGSAGGFSAVTDYIPKPVKNLFGMSTSKELEITIASPNGGEKWETGREYNLLWFTEGQAQGKVNLYFLRGTTTTHTIATGVTNTGRYSWAVPEDLEESNDYKVKISSAGGEAVDYSDNFFSIEKKKEATTTQKPDYPTLLGIENEEKVELNAEEDLKSVLYKKARQDIASGSFLRLTFIDNDSQKQIPLQKLFSRLGWEFATSVVEYMAQDYTLAAYHQSEFLTYNKPKRLVFAVRTNSPQKLIEKIREKESSLREMLAPSFFLDLELGEPFSDQFLVNNKTHPEVIIYYQNSPKPDLSVDYAVVKENERSSVFVLTSSRESMYGALDLILNNSKAKQSEPAATTTSSTTTIATSSNATTSEEENLGKIEGKVCYPAGGVPEDWTPIAENVKTGETYRGERLEESFLITGLPEATYNVYADAQGLKGRYSNAVACGLGTGCEDHEFIDVELKAGGTVEGADPCDWYGFGN